MYPAPSLTVLAFLRGLGLPPAPHGSSGPTLPPDFHSPELTVLPDSMDVVARARALHGSLDRAGSDEGAFEGMLLSLYPSPPNSGSVGLSFYLNQFTGGSPPAPPSPPGPRPHLISGSLLSQEPHPT